MNGATELNSKISLPKDSSLCDFCGRPAQTAEANPAASARELESSASDESKKHDQVSISEQAKERLKVKDAFILETPPHITTVKEHIQKLAREALRPVYEEEEADSAIQVANGDEKEENVPSQEISAGESNAPEAGPAESAFATPASAPGQQAPPDGQEPGQPGLGRDLIV